MRKLLIAAIVLIAGWCAYWVIGAGTNERAIAQWIEDRSVEGWQAESRSVDTTGFPVGFNTRISEPLFADPRTGVAFSAQSLTIESRALSPTHLTATLSPTAQIATPYQQIDLSHEGAVAQLFVDSGPRLTLDHTSGELQNAQLASSLGWGATLAGAQFSTQRRSDSPLTHDIDLTMTDFAPSDGMMSQLDPDGLLADRFERFEATMAVTFERPWDITALEGPRPQPRRIEISKIAATWGKLDLQMAGLLDVDEAGTPSGKLAIKAANWREMVDLAAAAGVIPADLVGIARQAGGLLAGMSGKSDTIDADLTLRDGMIVLGFIPIAPAPKIVIR
ncbi:DUF2125 domain-containing protein [Celeribacter arenosi]|uniref:DUF2125 domain-containing protein n=1 Tax=Celeribacter arenosi TaxID=792649 RepID=A0ABP7K363_9RHOB